MNHIESKKESELICKSQAGDKSAYGQLVQKYMQRAYYCALGLVSSHDAALDLSQEAFVRAYRAIRKVDPERQFFTWYYQILRNLCLNYLRDKSRHARPFSEIDENAVWNISDHSMNAEERLEAKELCQEVWKAINQLTPLEREVIVLKDFQELSYKEIADVLGCPIGTVMSRLYNARKALKRRMEVYVYDRV